MELIPFTDPKEWLLQEWHARRAKNAALSLRSFARFLQIPAGRLSEVLSGKRKISLELAERLADRLAIDPATRSALTAAVRKTKRGRRRQRVAAQDEHDPEYRQLTIDAFHVIADWYHFAILSLRDCANFRPEEDWIARRLGIGKTEVCLALTRLERLGLIEREGSTWIRTEQNLTTTHDVRSAGLRRGHRGILERAIASLETVDVNLRDVTNMTMAVHLDDLPQAKALLAQFRRKFAKTIEVRKDRTEVYTLALQFFPLTEARTRK